MIQESTSIPKTVFGDLGLQEGDVLEGRAGADYVDVRVVRRAADRGMTAAQFVAKWRGRFPAVAEGDDPRLSSLLEKHVKPT